jgi:hypothetical protein
MTVKVESNKPSATIQTVKPCTMKRVMDQPWDWTRVREYWSCPGTGVNSTGDEGLILTWHTEFGWACGLHPGLTDLRTCLEKKQLAKNREKKKTKNLFLSMLREPMARFVSEWIHVASTGSTWMYENKPVSNDQKCLKSKVFFIF